MNGFSAEPIADFRLEDLSWLEGHWSGLAGRDETDEIWSGVSADAMMGMFRSVSNGQVRFYEFMTITTSPERTDLTIKHFNPDLVGWEEKEGAARFVLTEAAANRAVFYQTSGEKQLWLVYESPDGSELRIYFRPVENSPVGDTVFSLRRRQR